MKARPYKLVGGEYLLCPPSDATHLRIKIQRTIELPVQIKGTRAGTGNWSWNGDTEKPTLKPSIKTKYYDPKTHSKLVCHTFLNDGIVTHLADCTCGKAGATEPLREPGN